MKTALVLGAGGFIGHHLVRRLREEDYFVTGVDLKYPEFCISEANAFIIGDLRNQSFVRSIFGHSTYDEVYQLAADMGGAAFVFTGENDADILYNSSQINLNVAECIEIGTKLFYSSSACAYPGYNQLEPNNPNCTEDSIYPAQPDSDYGWEKIFSERLYQAYARNNGLDVRIARFHNIFGIEGAWRGGREKSPAALCRKVIEGVDELEIWGDGEQTRTFLYVDECIEGVRRLMKSPKAYSPLNIGSTEMVTINTLAEMIMNISGKCLKIKHIPGPLGVRGRCSDNKKILASLGWEPNYPLLKGLEKTYSWINSQINGK